MLSKEDVVLCHGRRWQVLNVGSFGTMPGVLRTLPSKTSRLSSTVIRVHVPFLG